MRVTLRLHSGTAHFFKRSNPLTGAQYEEVARFFEQWKGNSYQVDDVCLMGVRV